MAAEARIRIDDWDAPKYSEAASGALEQIAASVPADLPITPESVLGAAQAETGLSDFGDEWFREPLSRLCSSISEDIELTAWGRPIVFGMLARLARNRLRIEDLIARHPQVADIVIDRPIFIVGLPRTGTTHLTNLIAADPQIRSMRYWESLEPVLPDPQPTSLRDDPRHARGAEAWGMVDLVLPHMKALHEMSPDHVHEDIEPLGFSFASPLFEGMVGPVRTYNDWYRTNDQTPSYAYFKRALQAMQWLRGGSRWVLKTPGHLEHLKALHAVFPDAVLVFTHRDPVTITASCVTMEVYLNRLTVLKPDFRETGAYWSERCEQFMRAAVELRDAVPAETSTDILFSDFMADQVGTVRRIYDLAGLTVGPKAEAAFASYQEAHSREQHGRITYDLRTFGIDPEERRRALAFYADRFGTPSEN
jgi:hypothetical protein